MSADTSSDEETVFSASVRSPRASVPRQLRLLTFLSAIGGFLFGYDTGVVSGAMILLRQEFSLSHTWQEMIVSATVLSACLASLLAGYTADTQGRRMTVILASIMFTVGSVWLAAAGSAFSLLIGRLMVGAGVGLASHTVPLYISECSPADKRGELLTMNNIAITGGQLVASITCGLLSGVSGGWRWMLGLAAVPAIIQLLGFIMMPETPRHLVTQNKMEEAERVLSSLRSPHHSLREELEDIVISSRAGAEADASWISILTSRVSRSSILLGCLLQATQQLAGINTVMYYSASILVMAGLPEDTSIWLASLTAAINFIFCVLGLFLISRLSRRTLLFTSIVTVVTALLSISISFHFLSSHSGTLGSVLALISLCVYLAGFAPGLGILTWVINSEIHPGWCRARAVSLATATNWASNLLVSASFLSLVDSLGKPATFLLYAALTALGGGILAIFLPETKGVSLEETELLFEQRHQTRNSEADDSSHSLLWWNE